MSFISHNNAVNQLKNHIIEKAQEKKFSKNVLKQLETNNTLIIESQANEIKDLNFQIKKLTQKRLSIVENCDLRHQVDRAHKALLKTFEIWKSSYKLSKEALLLLNKTLRFHLIREGYLCLYNNTLLQQKNEKKVNAIRSIILRKNINLLKGYLEQMHHRAFEKKIITVDFQSKSSLNEFQKISAILEKKKEICVRMVTNFNYIILRDYY